MYKLLKENNIVVGVLHNDKDSIPLNPDNTDFVEYQKWLEEGNTPLPADEMTNGN